VSDARPGADLPSREQAFEILHRTLRATAADAAEASFDAEVTRLTGYAAGELRHTITEGGRALSLAAVFDRRVSRVTTTRIDAEGIADLARRAEAIARVPREPDLAIDLAGPPAAPSLPSKFDAATASDDHAAQTGDAAAVLRLARSRGLEAAGYVMSSEGVSAIRNTAGLEAYHHGTEAEAAVTMRRLGGEAETSGYGAAAAWRAAAIRLDEIAASVANKAIWGGPPLKLDPGEYTVVLEPLAVAELLMFLAEGFNARSVEEDDSFLTGRVGKDLFSPLFTLLDDAGHPLQRGLPFDGEGWPKRRVALIDKGRVAELLADRATAARMGLEPTGHGFPIPNAHGAYAANLVVPPGDASNEDLVAGCARGILVTRFWYARPVDPGTLTVTGLTRDGTFLIEDGRVTRRLADLRWNQSLIEAFAALDAVGNREAVVPMEHLTVVTPALRIPRFRFIS
jgi:predicted Zn-dependent protease